MPRLQFTLRRLMMSVLCVCVYVGLFPQFFTGALTTRERLLLASALLVPIPGVAIAAVGGRMWLALLVTIALAIGFLAFWPQIAHLSAFI